MNGELILKQNGRVYSGGNIPERIIMERIKFSLQNLNSWNGFTVSFLIRQ